MKNDIRNRPQSDQIHSNKQKNKLRTKKQETEQEGETVRAERETERQNYLHPPIPLLCSSSKSPSLGGKALISSNLAAPRLHLLMGLPFALHSWQSQSSTAAIGCRSRFLTQLTWKPLSQPSQTTVPPRVSRRPQTPQGSTTGPTPASPGKSAADPGAGVRTPWKRQATARASRAKKDAGGSAVGVSHGGGGASLRSMKSGAGRASGSFPRAAEGSIRG